MISEYVELLGAIRITTLAETLSIRHYICMNSLHMITFRCKNELFNRLENFALSRNLDRTSVLKLALHFYLNRCGF